MSKKTILDVDTIHAAAVADEQHSFADEATQSVFGQLAESTIKYTDRTKWESNIRVIEDEYMVKVHAKTEGAKTKGSKKTPGRWKYRTYLPAAWSSSKSVCGQAIEHGLKLDADSKKTATEKTLGEMKAEAKSEKTPKEKIHIAMDTARKVLMGVDGPTREKMAKDLKDLYNIDTSSGFWTQL